MHRRFAEARHLRVAHACHMCQTLRGTLAIVTVVVGCSSGSRLPPAAPSALSVHSRVFAGRVTHVDGHAASAAVVIVSSPSDGKVLAVASTTDDGRFVTTLPVARYAVTATDASASVYMPVVEQGSGGVSIRLDGECQRLAGRIAVGSPLAPHAVVQLGRMSALIGDIFGAALGSDGSFQACLPPATYNVTPPPDLATRLALVTVPTTDPFIYRTARRAAADQVPSDLGGLHPATKAEFIANFPPTTKLLGLGESNHGSREFYEERTSLVLQLAEERGVRLLMIEAGYGEVLALDDYVSGASVDVDRAVQDLGYWIYDTKTFLESLRRIREYNAKHPAQRIHLIGIDVQDTTGCVKFITQFSGSALSPAVNASLGKLASNSGKAWTTLAADEQSAVRDALGRLAATRGTGGSGSRSNRTMLAAKTLLRRLDLLEAPSALVPGLRDTGMAQMVLDVLATDPDQRATLWGHLGHVAREYLVGATTMGEHLAATLGDSYRAYALVAVRGDARAWDAKHEIGVIAQPLRTAPPASLESILASRSAGAHVTYWTFADQTGEAARWLKGVHALRSFGAVFMGESEISYWNLASIDGAILFDAVSPTEPTRTGERRAKPKTP